MRTVAIVSLLVALALPASAHAAKRVDAPRGIDLTIRTTSYGIPHIRARNYRSLGFGMGWAQGRAVPCTLAEAYVTVQGERSRFFGPDGSYDQSNANGTVPNNLQSDFFYAKIIEQGKIERMLEQPPPLGPKPELLAMGKGFAAGYNAALEAGVKDPACSGEEWVRPIEPIDVWRRIYQLQLLASSGVAIDGIVGAAPPGGGLLVDRAARARQARALPQLGDGRFDRLLGDLGSNAIALGKEKTKSGHGLHLSNPHFPWEGPERFYHAQITVPRKLNAAGSALIGVPLALNGFNRGLAWTHTVSTARRFAVYELPLALGDPTSYRWQGQTNEMERTEVTVSVREPDGSLGERSHTFYDTELGPVLTSITGLPIFPWTATSTYVLFDANADGLGRLVNHFFDLNRARSVAAHDRILRAYQGIPWVNSISADKAGNAYYADIGAMPNLDVDRYDSCLTVLGRVTDDQARLAVVDGSNPDCAPGEAEGAAAPGLLPPSRQPSLVRDDYVSNSNDGYWVVNADKFLTGFSRIIGVERVPQLFRTRYGIKAAEDGSDFTLRKLIDVLFSNRSYSGELWRDDLVAYCKENPTVSGSNGSVDVADACPALESWDLRHDVDSRGELLFRRFSEHVWLDADFEDPWADAFDPEDPINTPSKLNTNNRKVQRSFADAVSELRDSGIPFDAQVGDYSYVMRNGTKIPIHGSNGAAGGFNVISTTFKPGEGWPEPPHGTSYVHAVELTGGCPRAFTLQAYSQSTNPTSRHFADQTKLYAREKWIRFPFCGRQIARDRALRITRFR